MAVTIIIPAFNEEEGIGEVIDSVKMVMTEEEIRYELIVVDDGSSDATAKIAKNKKVKVISHPQNAGYGAALMTGIRKSRFENVAIIDADGTYPARQLPKLLAFTEKGFDLVIGARSGKYFQYPWFKEPVRFLFKLISEFVAGTKIPDPNSGFRIYKKIAILPLLNTRTCRGFSFTTSTTLIFLLEGKFVKFVPIEYFPRKGKSKVKFVKDALRAGQILAETIVYYNPFKLFLLMSWFLGFLMVVFFLIYLFSHTLLSLTFFSLFFLSTVFSFCFGLALSIFKRG